MSNIHFANWKQHCRQGFFQRAIYYIKRLFWIASLNDLQFKIMSDIMTDLIIPTFDLSKVYEVDIFPTKDNGLLKACYNGVFLFKINCSSIKLRVIIDSGGCIETYFKSNNHDIAIADISTDYEHFKKKFNERIVTSIKKYNIDILKKESHA